MRSEEWTKMLKTLVYEGGGSLQNGWTVQVKPRNTGEAAPQAHQGNPGFKLPNHQFLVCRQRQIGCLMWGVFVRLCKP